MAQREVEGTLEELRNERMDVAEYGSCARMVKDGKKILVLGCRRYDTCPFSCKDTSGPRNYGLRFMKKGRGRSALVSEKWAPCFDAVELIEKEKSAGNAIEIIATEVGFERGLPHKVLMRGTEPRDKQRAYLKPDNAGAYQDWRAWVEIPAFERPGQAVQLEQDRYVSELREERKEQMERERAARILNIDTKVDADAPTDKAAARERARARQADPAPKE